MIDTDKDFITINLTTPIERHSPIWKFMSDLPITTISIPKHIRYKDIKGIDFTKHPHEGFNILLTRLSGLKIEEVESLNMADCSRISDLINKMLTAK